MRVDVDYFIFVVLIKIQAKEEKRSALSMIGSADIVYKNL